MEELNSDSNLERLLRKYLAVWLWSILVAAATGISLSYANYRTDRPWGYLGFLLLALFLLGTFALLLAWRFLVHYLSRVLLPLIEGDSPRERYLGLLPRALNYLILAVVIRLLLLCSELLLGVGRGF